MSGLKTDQSVNVIFDAANFQCHSFQSTNGAAEVFMQARAPVWFDERATFFSGTNPVVVKAVIGGAHLDFAIGNFHNE